MTFSSSYELPSHEDTQRARYHDVVQISVSHRGDLRRNGKATSIPGVTGSPTDPETNKTMVWDNQRRMVDDPEGEGHKIILS